jgi:hypothetical protein
MSIFDPEGDSDTLALHAVICPGCSCEPEVVVYWREETSKRRVGYTCACGFRVIGGVVHGVNIG